MREEFLNQEEAKRRRQQLAEEGEEVLPISEHYEIDLQGNQIGPSIWTFSHFVIL